MNAIADQFMSLAIAITVIFVEMIAIIDKAFLASFGTIGSAFVLLRYILSRLIFWKKQMFFLFLALLSLIVYAMTKSMWLFLLTGS